MGLSRLLSLMDMALPRNGLISGRKITAWGKSLIGSDIQFSDLEIPFACVATDIMTGQEVVLNEGSVMEAFRASACIPGVFSVAKYKGRYLVDGALVNPMPINVAKNMGGEFIIAVNVLPDIDTIDENYLKEQRSKKGFKEPNFMDVLMQSSYISSHSLV